MALKINQNKIEPKTINSIVQLCPFNAIEFKNNILSINANCKMCKICTKKGDGVIEWVDEQIKVVNKNEWKNIIVFVDYINGRMHPIVFELISKAKELAKITGQLVGVLVIGCNTKPIVEQLLNFGVDLVYACDHESLKEYNLVTYKNVFIDFVQTYKPSSILVGATNYGRAIAPGVAAHFKTGMTADCTKLEMEPNTDLIQIRPAFGGSIMAKIKTPNTRPQICTVRYKVFDKNNNLKFNNGKVVNIPFKSDFLSDDTKLLNIITKKTEVDLVDADVIVVVGKGFKKKEDLSLAYDLAKLLNGQVGCTRPLIENNWFDAKKQIGLSGRTVKPKLIITLGVSGAIQFMAGMSSSDLIISINNDKDAQIFEVAHYGFVGDLYEIVPKLIENLKRRK